MDDCNTTEFAAFIGIDWADKKHDVCIRGTQNDTIKFDVIASSPEAMSIWLLDLRKKFPKGKIAISLEQSKGALIFHLMMYDFITLFPINPRALARFREAFAVSGAKSDPDDAYLLQEFVANYHKNLSPWVADDEITRSLSFMVYNRRKAVNECTKISKRLKACLKTYYPQALEFTGDSLKNNMAIEFLEKWPQLSDLKRARRNTVKNFYLQHNVRSDKIIKRRLDLYQEALPLTDDNAVIASCLITVKMLVGQIRQLNLSIKEFDQAIDELYKSHPDKEIFDSFPGAGQILRPRLLAAWGSDRDRHQNPESMQQYSGIAPVTRASGNLKVIHRRLACPKFILQTFHEFANYSRLYSAWAQAYYEMLRERGKRHHTAVRALAFKWIRIMFRCWKDRTKYDEVKYLMGLKKSNSPLREYL